MRAGAIFCVLSLVALAVPPAAAATAFTQRNNASAACERAIRQDNLDEQIRLFSLCVDTGGGVIADADALALRGFAYLYKGDLDAALADFHAAIEEEENYGGYYLNRAQAWVRMGRLDDALADVEAALERRQMSREVMVYVVRGEILTGMGQEAAALADFDRALELRRRNVRALAGKALLLAGAADASVRDGAAALDLAQRALDQDDESVAAVRALAAAHAELGDFAEAVRVQSEAIAMAEEMQVERAFAFDPVLREHLALYQAQQPLRGVTF